MTIENSIGIDKKLNNFEQGGKSQFERYFDAMEHHILEERPTIAHKFIADLEKKLDKVRAEGEDIDRIQDFHARFDKLKHEAGCISVLSSLDKAKSALKDKESDSSLAASWYFAAEEKLEECKDILSPDERASLEEQIRNFRLSSLEGVIANHTDDYKTQKDKELEESQKYAVAIYEHNLAVCESCLNDGSIDKARSEFDSLNAVMFEELEHNPFLGPDLQERINEVKKKLEIKNS